MSSDKANQDFASRYYSHTLCCLCKSNLFIIEIQNILLNFRIYLFNVKRIYAAITPEMYSIVNHTYATVLRNEGVPVSIISPMLGHTSITTTEIYLADLESENRARNASLLSS